MLGLNGQPAITTWTTELFRTDCDTFLCAKSHRACACTASPKGAWFSKALVREHNKAYEEMRAYFNDITANTLDLIKALKADAVELQRREAAAEALALELAQENKRLIDPLQTVRRLRCTCFSNGPFS